MFRPVAIRAVFPNRPLCGIPATPAARIPVFGLMATIAWSLTGCYHMYSQPYGYSGAPVGTYPGTMPYQAPIQTLTPGQPYVPGGATYPSTIPPGTAPTYQQNGGGLQPIPETSAPSYNSTPNTNPGTTTSPATPDPYFPNTMNEPAKSGLQAIQPTAMAEPAPLNPPTAGLREVRSAPAELIPPTKAVPLAQTAKEAAIMPTPAEQQSTSLMPLSDAPPPAVQAFAPPKMSPPPARAADPFGASPPASPAPAAAPIAGPAPVSDIAPAGAQSLWDVETKKVVAAEMTTFGHDPKFGWLRGVVSQEPSDNTWSIVYDDNPSAADKWAGHLSLAPNPRLSELKDGDVVEIQGQLDNVVHDRLGKPVYVISNLTKPFETKK